VTTSATITPKRVIQRGISQYLLGVLFFVSYRRRSDPIQEITPVIINIAPNGLQLNSLHNGNIQPDSITMGVKKKTAETKANSYFMIGYTLLYKIIDRVFT